MTPELNLLFPVTISWGGGVENMHQEEFQACFGEKMEKNSNNANEDEEEVGLDDNYDYLSQLRVNKKVDKVRAKRKL